MGKLGSLITTAIFIGAIALLVYMCCRHKRKRSLPNWAEFLGQNNQQNCPNPGLPGSQNQVPAICAGSTGYEYDRSVPHSIVSPPASGYPYAPGYGGYPPYPGTNPNQTTGGPYSAYGTPYPMMGPPQMPMPGTTREGLQTAPYPAGYPEDLPPPYSVVVAQSGAAPKY